MWVRSLGQKDPWKRKWQPTPVFLPGESNGQRSLAGYRLWGHKESDMTEQLTLSLCKCLKARGPPPQGSCLLLRHSSIYHFGPSDSHQLGQIILVSRVLGPSSLFLKIPALIVCLWTFSLIVQNVLKSPSNAILSSCLHLTVQPYNMKNLLTPYRSTELRTPSCKVKTNKQTKITQ